MSILRRNGILCVMAGPPSRQQTSSFSIEESLKNLYFLLNDLHFCIYSHVSPSNGRPFRVHSSRFVSLSDGRVVVGSCSDIDPHHLAVPRQRSQTDRRQEHWTRGVVRPLNIPTQTSLPRTVLCFSENSTVSLSGQPSFAFKPRHLRMLEFAALHDIRAIVETFPLGQVNEVVQLVKANKVRFRAVLTHAGQFPALQGAQSAQKSGESEKVGGGEQPKL